jgi:hypothetical protein
MDAYQITKLKKKPCEYAFLANADPTLVDG